MSRIFAKGNNYLRQLGGSLRAKEINWQEVQFQQDCKIKKIDANGAQSAAMLEDGRVFFWGWNFDALTMANMLNYYRRFPSAMTVIQRIPFISSALFLKNYHTVPTGLSAGADRARFVDFRLGFGFMILQDTEQMMYGFGDNRKGQCGISYKVMDYVEEPTRILKPKQVPLKTSQFSIGLQFCLSLASKLN